MIKLLAAALVVAMFSGTAAAQCDNVSGALELEWDQILDPSVTEIGVFVSDTPGGHDFAMPPFAVVPTATGEEYIYADGQTLPDGEHYFVVTARNIVSTNSLPSNEICATLIQVIPGAPTNLRIKVSFVMLRDGGVEGEIFVEVGGEKRSMAFH